jgi:PAS domain S-box-containing protein
VDPQLYQRLLRRLIALPVLSLVLLALLLGFGLQRVQQSARDVDHCDLILSHANRLTKLFIDEETGFRGYLLTRDPAFLEPFHTADQQIEPEIASLQALLQGMPHQLERLHRMDTAQQQWEQEAYRQIKSPPSQSELEPLMLQQKQRMDIIRTDAEGFRVAEEGIRARRSTTASQIGRASLISLICLALFIGLLITWATYRIFHQLTATYNHQLEETKRRAEETYEREQWLNTTLRSIGDAVIACDTKGDIVFMNLVAEQLTGWTEAEAKGTSLHKIFRIFNEETRATVESPVDKVRRLGTIVGLANHTFLVSKHGSEVNIDDSGAPIRNSAGDMIGIVLVFRDITDRRHSETALMRAEKLATAGRMAASVAHEVNNPLEGLTNLIFIARTSDSWEEVRHLLHQAEGELGRIAHITRQSLGFYRESSAHEHFQPAQVVREVTDFYSPRALARGITLIANTHTEMEILGAPGELRQILSNLLANSLDACPKDAVIRVDVAQASDPRNPTRTGVRITVADNGQGIAGEHLTSIFEPFFTTKKDTGTGLGLWVSRELIHKHGGSIRVRSRTTHPRCGTSFSLFLPQATSAHTKVSQA